MRAPAIGIGLLWLSCAGCASVPMASPKVPSGARTVTVVGDRPVGVASGEPGASQSISADPTPPMEVDRRIAGRVVDESGDPVPDAVIRLAVDGAGAGRSVEVTTDAAGRFGLSRLRSGSEYTLIAEWEDEQGELLSGRRVVVAPESNVEIVLREPRRAGGVSTVSERNGTASEDLPEPGTPRRANDAPMAMSHPEDELPPAPEAEVLIGESGSAQGDGFGEPISEIGAETRPSATAPGAGMVWRRPGSMRLIDDSPTTPRATESSTASRPAEIDDGANPLPPAREPRANGGSYRDDGLAHDPADEKGRGGSLAGSGSAPPPFPADPSDHPNQGFSGTNPVPQPSPAPTPAAPAGGSSAPSESLIDAALKGQGTPSLAPASPPSQPEAVPSPAAPEELPTDSANSPAPPMPDLPTPPAAKETEAKPEPNPPALAERPDLPGSGDSNQGPDTPSTPALDEPTAPPPITNDAPAPSPAKPEVKPEPEAKPEPIPALEPKPASEPKAEPKAEPAPALPPSPLDGLTPMPEGPAEPDAPPPIAGEGEPKAEPAPAPESKPEPTPSEPKPGADKDPAPPPATDAKEKEKEKEKEKNEDQDKTAALSGPAPRMTWGQLSGQIEQQIRRAPSAMVERVSHESSALREPSVPDSPSLREPPVPVERASRPAPAGAATPFTKASCSYDPRRRRLESFALSDVDGQEVRLADLNAKLILIDFWGTWCSPCMKAIPELVSLQREFGPAGLAVVGVAYEQGEPAEWPKRIAEATAPLSVNYRLLMGEADGRPCPLRAAFQVQVFPTLVLIDGNGQVLWRDQGATEANMRRLRRIIDAKLKPNLAVREPITTTR